MREGKIKIKKDTKKERPNILLLQNKKERPNILLLQNKKDDEDKQGKKRERKKSELVDVRTAKKQKE